jgi:hypothetical protein
MGNNTARTAVKDYVSPLDIGWFYWSDRYHLTIENRRHHAVSRRSEAHAVAMSQKLMAYTGKVTATDE